MENQKNNIRIISSDRSWIEGEAIRQLEKTASLPGVLMAAGFPDLHPEKGKPNGAAYLTEEIFYPYLIGNDIGCGMGLFQTDISVKKAKLDKLVSRLSGLERPVDGDVSLFLSDFDVEGTDFDRSIGTIGKGNHFAELQRIEEIFDETLFEALCLSRESFQLLIHSGSRGLGESILRSHVDKHKDGGLQVGTEEAREYIAKHDNAVRWARANRTLIAERFCSCLRGNVLQVIDHPHNTLSPINHNGRQFWLHRKGAAPANAGPVVIPGSRDSLSYLVAPIGDGSDSAYSLAHGAGRKWRRSDAKARLEKRFSKTDFERTALGGRVICEDKSLIFEEAPQAYKDINVVIEDMVSAGLIKVIATMRPVITYKVRN